VTFDLTSVRERFALARDRHVFPAAAVEAGGANGPRWREAFGALTYEPDAAPATNDTIFDLASLTKVMAIASLMMRAVECRRLRLDDRVADYCPSWRGDDRSRVTLADLLEHTGGLTAYLPFFRDHEGREAFERAICTLPLEYAPRSASIYSDLGFMLLGFILQDVGGAPLAEQFQAMFPPDPAYPLAFNPPRDWRARTAPTELDFWRGRLLQGDVHDENAWALRGAAGHAGLFGTAPAVGKFARQVLAGLLEGASFAQPETFRRFAAKSTVPGSSRALAWDTMLPTSSCGTRLSARAIGHTGFTGTSLWIDPAQDLYVVLLTNRVHPTRDNNQLQPFRRWLHDQLAVGSSQ
jgi:CubicO group peptidase (beta-lactamase class C family)